MPGERKTGWATGGHWGRQGDACGFTGSRNWGEVEWRLHCVRGTRSSRAIRPRRESSETPTEEDDVLSGKQLASYQEFYDSARHNEILPEKTTLMLHLAAAMAFGCDP